MIFLRPKKQLISNLIIFHLAAESHVDRSIDSPKNSFKAT